MIFPTTLALACGLLLLAPSLQAQSEDGKQEPTRSLATGALSGQKIAVLPLTLVVADPALEADSVYADYRNRRAALSRSDSLVGEAFQSRGPEVHWVLPPELRKVARRSAGFVADPDHMGQAILRAPNLIRIPDPLRSSLRGLSAVVDGRLAMVPAALGFGAAKDGRVQADLTLVLADTRSGKIVWRSQAQGQGASPDEALKAAMAAVLPFSSGQ